MERCSRGDIWTVELVAHPKPRPALIVSINAVNDLCPDVLLIPITSHPGPLRVPIPQPEKTGLRIPSYAKCESVGPSHKSRLKRKIGTLSADAWGEVETGMKRVLGLRD